MPNSCRVRKPNGEQCRANAQAGKNVCVFHDPEQKEDVQRARRAGGINRTRTAIVLPPETPPYQFQNSLDIARFLGETINQVRCGQLDARTANTLGFLANTLFRVLELGPAEERMVRLEARFGIPTDVEPPTLGKGQKSNECKKPNEAN